MAEGHDWNRQIIETFHANGGKNVGRFGDNLLLLTTTGGRTGRHHTTPVAFTRSGDRYVIVASKGGAPHDPAWAHNLRAHPRVTLEVGAERFLAWASEVKGAERDRLYAAHAERFPNFVEYQQKTKRVIPVFALERLPDGGPE